MMTTQQPTQGASPTIRVYLGPQERRQWLPIGQLISMQAELNYTWLIWADGRRVLLPRTIKYVVAQVPAEAFVRLRRDYVVNLTYVICMEYNPYDRLMVLLQTGERVAVTRRRVKAVREQLLAQGVPFVKTGTRATPGRPKANALRLRQAY